MKDIEISKNSKLFKFMKFMSHTPLCFFIDYDKYDNTINSFNDICTFVRHFLITVFICIPLQLITALFILGVVLYGLVWLPLASIFNYFMGNTTGGFGMGMVISYGIIILTYIVLLVLQNTKINTNVLVKLKPKEDGFISNTIELVAAKHHSFCSRIKMKD